MPADLDVLLLPPPPSPGCHDKAVVVTGDRQHVFCRTVVEGAVEMPDEF
ncbi:hypothetical protein QO004_000909 [Rhizobium mesoamericanum]|nr:hypothetical protein [Rhizobium mesoamericanum]